MNAHLRLLSANRSQLATLARTVNENVELAIFSGREVVVVDQIASPERLRGVTKVGKSFSLHARLYREGHACSVAARSRQLRCCHRFYHDLRIRRSPNGRRCWRNWRRCVAPTSPVDIEEHDVGICAVATAMIGPTGALQAIAIVIPSGRFKAKKELAVEVSKW